MENLSSKVIPDDFSHLKPGDLSPTGDYKIKGIIVQSEEFIVCINENNMIDWETSENYGDWDENGGKVLNKVSLLENLTERIFRSTGEIYKFKCMIAEALARIIDGKTFQQFSFVVECP